MYKLTITTTTLIDTTTIINNFIKNHEECTLKEAVENYIDSRDDLELAFIDDEEINEIYQYCVRQFVMGDF